MAAPPMRARCSGCRPFPDSRQYCTQLCAQGHAALVHDISTASDPSLRLCTAAGVLSHDMLTLGQVMAGVSAWQMKYCRESVSCTAYGVCAHFDVMRNSCNAASMQAHPACIVEMGAPAAGQ